MGPVGVLVPAMQKLGGVQQQLGGVLAVVQTLGALVVDPWLASVRVPELGRVHDPEHAW